MIDELKFWKAKPAPPLRDFRAWSLLIPAIASAVGFFAFAVLAYSFTELISMPAIWRVALVIGGALALAFGGEIGTLTCSVEVFRKHANGGTLAWDWLTLVVSILATLGEFLVAFATLLGLRARWGPAVQEWGPVILGLLAALDAYSNFVEFGFYLASYDQRVESWQEAWETEQERRYLRKERRATREQRRAESAQNPRGNGAEMARNGAESAQNLIYPRRSAQNPRGFRPARAEWRGFCAEMAKDGGIPRDFCAESVQAALEARGYARIPDSTAREWAREAIEIAKRSSEY